jgi:hypothetical protein
MCPNRRSRRRRYASRAAEPWRDVASNNFVPNGTWLQPISILTGRMAKFSAEFTF